MNIVPYCGPAQSPVIIIGEAPGATEWLEKRPFCGASGREQDFYLSRHDLTTKNWHLTNLVQEYIPGNPDPTPDQIAYWTPHLIKEIRECSPRLVLSVGAHSTRWLLGDDASLHIVHGLPHRPLSSLNLSSDICVIPVTHPAAGFYDPSKRASISWDYYQAAYHYRLINAGGSIDYREDTLAGKESYSIVSGSHLARLLLRDYPDHLSLDTEGTIDDPFSIQICWQDGIAYSLLFSDPTFHDTISALSTLAKHSTVFTAHNWIYDYPMCSIPAHFNLSDLGTTLSDTMYKLYLIGGGTTGSDERKKPGLEPQGLKPASRRWLGMAMASHDETVGALGISRQLDYLRKVAAGPWPDPGPQPELQPNGTIKLKKSWTIQRLAANIIKDVESGKLNKDGETTNPTERWKKIPRHIRKPAESQLGKMPHGSMKALYAIDPDRACYYMGRDPDATLRLDKKLDLIMTRMSLHDTHRRGMATLPSFAEIQINGMPASRSALQSLSAKMTDHCLIVQSRISHRYFSSRPFNPNSTKDVGTLMRRRGLDGLLTTATGEVSTSRQSIEHLAYEDEAIAAVFDYRRHDKIKDTYCTPVISDMPDESENPQDIYPVDPKLKNTRVATRRLSSFLLTIPTRTEIGRMVRACYMAPPGLVLGGWDYSTLELVLAAHYAEIETGDTTLSDVFRDPSRDAHSEAAARMFNIPLSQVDKVKHRYPAKTTGYGVLYGMGPDGLLTQFRMDGVLTYTKEDCGRFIRGWLDARPGVKQCIRNTAQRIYKDRQAIIRDHWGMPRYLPGIWSHDPAIAAEAARVGYSHTIQGLAQGMIQNAQAHIYPQLRFLYKSGINVQWRLQVHDELILSFPPEYFDLIDSIVVDGMVNHSGIDLVVPLKVEGKMGKTWADLK